MYGISILLGGDIVPTESNREILVQGDLDRLLGSELKNVIERSDFRIFNLEAPLTDIASPISKHGPSLRASADTINGIKALKPSLITLANNHIMDHNKQGLISTMNLLSRNNINMIGAGLNLSEASQPFIIKKNGIRVGIYACTDHEFSVATKEKMGANPFDPLESLDHINELKGTCHYVIVLYHGGKELYPYPSPYLQKVCRKMAEKGADLVICQHSHCVGCSENYNNSKIVYGQGNFLFDGSDNELWKSSLLIELELGREHGSIEYIPLVKCDNTVSLADGKRGEEILQAFKERSTKITEPEFVEKEYMKFADLQIDAYLKAFRGGKYLYRAAKKLLNKKMERVYSKKQLLAIEDYIMCDAHRELLLNGIRNRYRKRDSYQ